MNTLLLLGQGSRGQGAGEKEIVLMQ